MPSVAVERVVAAFLDSEDARALPLEAAAVRRAALLFVESSLDDHGIEPRLLDGEQLREVLALTARKFGRGEPLIARAGSVVRALFAHLGATAMVPNAYEIENALAGVEKELARLAAAVPDEQRVSGKTQPLTNRAAKLGRNDPCPCGSGRKFKQCCGKSA